MDKIEIEKKNVEAAYKVANEETKKVLDALFGRKPTFDDYTSIKTYEDACEALDITPIYFDDAKRAVCEYIGNHWDYRQDMPKHVLALMKLEIISRALRGREFDKDKDKYGYAPLWFFPEGRMRNDAAAYVLACPNMPSIDIRLMQDTQEKAEYFGRQFIGLWAEYLGFEVKTEESKR